MDTIKGLKLSYLLLNNLLTKEDLKLSIKTNSNNERITDLFVGNAKPLVKKYDFIKGFEGGYLKFDSIEKNKVSNSNLKIFDFKLKEVPALTKLLTLASLQGIADTLSGEGIRFESFEMKSNSKGNVMTIDDALAMGPAVSILLNEYQKVLSDIKDPRWRIEHSQVIDLNEFQLYNDKILPSIQPTHATSDMYWAYDRLGERIEGAYAFKDLLERSKRVALGTDFPVEKVNPFHTFYSSVERKDLDGYPENGFQMENALTREETLKGMTIWGAYFNFEENEKGSIEIGKSADFIVINQNIMEIDADKIPKTKVLKTFLDGKVVYQIDNL